MYKLLEEFIAIPSVSVDENYRLACWKVRKERKRERERERERKKKKEKEKKVITSPTRQLVF